MGAALLDGEFTLSRSWVVQRGALVGNDDTLVLDWPEGNEPGMTTAAYQVVPDFLPRAEKLRECIERHLANPSRHGPEHQVWNYWHVPGIYTYLRTNPERIIEKGLLDDFFCGSPSTRWTSSAWTLSAALSQPVRRRLRADDPQR
jgi:hypothetical protein